MSKRSELGVIFDNIPETWTRNAHGSRCQNILYMGGIHVLRTRSFVGT